MANGRATSWQERLVQADPTLRVHLLGIGGAGLSAIARVLHEQGVQVSGSDRQASKATTQLAELGIRTVIGQLGENLTGLPLVEQPDVVLISSAVDKVNPERAAADHLGIPVVKRDDFLPVLLAERQLIAVAGSAGKSTTTAMIVKLLRDAGRAIGYIIGAELPGYQNAAAGRESLFVIEADEYDGMFLGLRPTMAVVTNVIWDHPDCYPTPEAFRQAFQRFVDRVSPAGLVITCADDPGAAQLQRPRGAARPRWLTYGFAEDADLVASNAHLADGEQVADLRWDAAPQEPLHLATMGRHNVQNALAALAVARFCEVALPTALASLRTFGGASRRFEVKGVARGVTVIDDYAHHPSKVRATLAAARMRYPTQRIWALFQPHTYSRTQHLLADMAASLADADAVVVTDIFAAREVDEGLVHARDIVAASSHPQIRYIAALDDAASELAHQVQPGDVVVVMGAGDSYRVAETLLGLLRSDE